MFYVTIVTFSLYVSRWALHIMSVTLYNIFIVLVFMQLCVSCSYFNWVIVVCYKQLHNFFINCVVSPLSDARE